MSERWVPLIDWEPYYEISTLGRVRSLPRVTRGRNNSPRTVKGQMLTPTTKDRYPLVGLSDASTGRKRPIRVHVLMARTFLGPKPPDMEVAHNNGDSHDNRLTNLRYSTHIDNVADCLTHGTRRLGMRHQNAKLNDHLVRVLRSRHGAGESANQMAKELGLSNATVANAIKGKTWAHVEMAA